MKMILSILFFFSFFSYNAQLYYKNWRRFKRIFFSFFYERLFLLTLNFNKLRFLCSPAIFVDPSSKIIITNTHFTHSFIHLFIYSFIHLFIYSFIHLFIYSFIHLFIHSFIHLFIYSFTYFFIHLFIYSFIHLFICSFIHVLNYLFFIHLFILFFAFVIILYIICFSFYFTETIKKYLN